MSRAAFALALLTVLAQFPTPDRSADPAALLARMPADSMRAATFVQRQQMDSAHAVLAPGIADARAAGDPRVLARWLRLDAMLEIQHGNGAEARRRSAEARRLAEAVPDTLLTMFVLRTEAMGHNLEGRYAAARALAIRWMSLAEACGNREYVGWGHGMLGFLDERAGQLDAAIAHDRKAVEILAAHGGPAAEAWATNQLGNVLVARGDQRAARIAYERVLELARALDNRLLEARALGNLGVVEEYLGDPGRGLVLGRESERLHAELGNNLDRVIAMDNISHLLESQGRVNESLALMLEAAEIVRRAGIESEIPWRHAALGRSWWFAGRPAAAFREWRAALAMGPEAPVDPLAASAAGLAAGLVEEDSLDAALAVLEDARSRLASGVGLPIRADLLVAHAGVLNALGRPAEALDIAAPLARELDQQGLVEGALAAWTQTARAHRLLGRTAAAHHALDRATAAWEEGRRRAADPDVREGRGAIGKELVAEVVALELGGGSTDPAAIRRAFDRMQQFKSRTLLERIASPRRTSDDDANAADTAWVTAGHLQRETLRPGELLLEAVVGREAGWLFAVTPNDLRVTRLPGERELHTVIGLARSLLVAPPPDEAALQAADAALARLGALLLGGHFDRVVSARAIIVAPDGVLHQVPWHALPDPAGEPLSGAHSVSVVPSATFFARVRTGETSGSRRDVLVACVSASVSDRPRLSGASREANWIHDSFHDVSIHFPGRPGADSLRSEDLAPFEVLHFAGHIRADDERPWLSGFVNTWAENPDQRRVLTAGDIAASRLAARLAVLSGCESAGGRAHPGEGVAGLTSAFLAAGVPTVVATLWPVDDRTTHRIMEQFYAALAAGDDAATALARGTRSIRENPRTAHPFYWAGYVLVGEAGTRVPLRRRTVSPDRVLAGAAGLAIGLTVLAGWRGWRRSV